MIEQDEKGDRRIVTIFDDIYNLPDCRDYYWAMHQAGFRTAHHAAAGFRQVRADLMAARGLDRIGVVDFASGYGIGAALMRHAISLDDVLARYQDPWFDSATTAEVINADRDWFTSHRRTGETDHYIGIDIADKALVYGVDVGIFEHGFAEDLEAAEPSDDLATHLATCDLVIECGSVAHMLPKALDRVLTGAKARNPWVITAPIRGNDTAEAIAVMQDHGLEVSALDVPPFRHRRFADADEQARAIKNAEGRGHDTKGYETTGYFHAQLFLGKPRGEAG